MIASTQTNAPLAGRGKGNGRFSTSIELTTTRLRSAGLRITQPRLAIMAALCRHEQPTSIEQIHAEVGAATCDLVTVYRCMAAFEKIGLVNRAFFHNGTALFKTAFDQAERYHVACKASNQLEALDPATSADLRRAIEVVEEKLRARGYADVGHIVEFFGVAPSSTRGAAHGMPVVH